MTSKIPRVNNSGGLLTLENTIAVKDSASTDILCVNKNLRLIFS